ncbi:HEAT repeat domain-containing protein [ANME-2 cluster archaeon]|nr:MAG: HEAT repeat domain-containing protein [ANME-2 cluster archaeon]
MPTTYVLGKISDKKACEFLIRLLEEDDTLVCVNVAYAPGEIGDTSAVEPLIDVLENVDK